MFKEKNRRGGTWTSKWKRKQLKDNTYSPPHIYTWYVSPWPQTAGSSETNTGKRGEMDFQTNPTNWLLYFCNLLYLIWLSYFLSLSLFPYFLSLIFTTLILQSLLPFSFPLFTSWPISSLLKAEKKCLFSVCRIYRLSLNLVISLGHIRWTFSLFLLYISYFTYCLFFLFLLLRTWLLENLTLSLYFLRSRIKFILW